MAEVGKDINKAKHLLERGDLVAIPTETVYGLAGNALDIQAVTSIFKAKDRPEFDPLIVHVSSLEKVKRYCVGIPPKANELAEAFWPGPLTILLERKDVIPDLVTAGLPTVGIRCPNHPLTSQLLKTLDFPLAAPSANPFGYVSPTTPQHVQDQLGEKIPYILDGGRCEIGVESTIVGFPDDAGTIYRLGGLDIEEIEKVIGKVNFQLNISSNPRAPGQLQSHYAPGKKLYLGNIDELLAKFRKEDVGILSFQKDFHMKHQYILSRNGSLEEAAQHLFSSLRMLDNEPVSVILAELVPDVGLGKAINDRLRRAAGAR
jgi:L-threonylcarbamoyladenylate synthase